MELPRFGFVLRGIILLDIFPDCIKHVGAIELNPKFFQNGVQLNVVIKLYRSRPFCLLVETKRENKSLPLYLLDIFIFSL